MRICAYIGKEEVIDMIDILKALSDETRMRIFRMILNGDMCVCEIENSLNLTQSNASRHLTVLKKAGILNSYDQRVYTHLGNQVMGKLWVYMSQATI